MLPAKRIAANKEKIFFINLNGFKVKQKDFNYKKIYFKQLFVSRGIVNLL